MKRHKHIHIIGKPACARVRRWVSAVLLGSVVGPATAQPRMEVTQDVMNMGELMFQQPKGVSFELRNTGSQPLRLTAVNASCGCTQVQWPREEIAPGATATIDAVYDARLLGTFQKELEVYSNASSEPTYLTLQGRVVAEFSGTDFTDFPVDLGNVRLSANVVEFDDVNSGDKPQVQLNVLNTSRTSYRPELMHLPPYLSATYLPEKLAAGRAGRILLTLDSEQLKSYGLTETTIYLARKMGDRVAPENEIGVSAVLLPAFAHLTAEQMASAPRLQLSADSLDFSDMRSKRRATKTILLTNSGHSPLIISNVQVYGRALGVSLSDRTIQPGKTAKLKVRVETALLASARTQPRVLIIANDPQRPKTVVRVK